jgi:hypothetical protein
MLRAPASDEHRRLLQLLAADVAAYIGLGAAALIVSGAATAGTLAVLAGAAAATAFVINGYAMQELSRGLGHGGLGRWWRHKSVAVARAGIALTAVTAIAFATGAISVRGHGYVIDRQAPATIAYVATAVLFVVMVARMWTLVAKTRYTARVHFENEPLRRLRRPELHQWPGHHPSH